VLLRNYRKDGTLFWNDLHVSPVPADAGGTQYFVWLMNDVSDLQEALGSVVAREREVHETAENERERFLGHFRGLVGLWVSDERTRLSPGE
jgi:hypothetical protein